MRPPPGALLSCGAPPRPPRSPRGAPPLPPPGAPGLPCGAPRSPSCSRGGAPLLPTWGPAVLLGGHEQEAAVDDVRGARDVGGVGPAEVGHERGDLPGVARAPGRDGGTGLRGGVDVLVA